MDNIELDRVGGGDLLHLAIAGPDRLDVEAALFKQWFCRPCIAADVVFADQGDVVGAGGFGEFAGSDDVVADSIVGDMVAQRLGDAAEALAVAGDDRNVQLLGRRLGHRVDIVADQADRTLGEDRDPLGQREEFFCLPEQHGQFLVATVDDVLLLKVGGELHVEFVNTGGTGHQVTARAPGVPTTADRAVGDVDHVTDRTPYNPFGAGIGTATGRHYSGYGFFV